MKTKIVFQIDEAGYFFGTSIADESPLEAGTFLLPAGCVEDAPPPHVEGKLRRMVAGVWQYEDIVPPTETEDPPIGDSIPSSIEKLRAFLSANPDVIELINQPA